YYASAVYVPVQSIVRVQGEPTVYVKAKEGLAPRVIQLGLDNRRMAHVVKGLKASEEVSLTPPLKDGTARTDDAISDAASQRIESANGSLVEAPSEPRGAEPLKMEPDANMREKFKSMTPEQREAFKVKRQQAESSPAHSPQEP
ncbi:MAG: hypothetical protein O3C57_08150, partial [Verrucomicrobia bacterium]|nr:hypothetical protein [Verrucomicrobiota bacterium]